MVQRADMLSRDVAEGGFGEGDELGVVWELDGAGLPDDDGIEREPAEEWMGAAPVDDLGGRAFASVGDGLVASGDVGEEEVASRVEALSPDARLIVDEALTIAAERMQLDLFKEMLVEAMLDVCTPAELGSPDPNENYASCVRRHNTELRYRRQHLTRDASPEWKTRLFRLAQEEVDPVAAELGARPEDAAEARLFVYDMTARYQAQRDARG